MPEMLEVSIVHSLAGELMGGQLRTERPFRALHPSASMAALVGGGSRPRTGEVSLGHLGVLFLDELKSRAAQDCGLPGRDRGVTAVVVETALGLAAEPAGFDVFHKQRAGTVFRIR